MRSDSSPLLQFGSAILLAAITVLLPQSSIAAQSPSSLTQLGQNADGSGRGAGVEPLAGGSAPTPSYVITLAPGTIQPASSQAESSETQFSLFDSCRPEDSTLANTAAQLAKAGQFDRSLQLADQIESSVIKPFTLVYLIDRLAKAQQFDQAMNLTQTLPDQDDSTSSSLGASFFSFSPFGDNFRQQGYMVISFRLAEAGRSEESLKLIRQIQAPSIKPALLLAVAAQFEAQGKTTQASKLLTEAAQGLILSSNYSTESMVDSAALRVLQRGQVDSVLQLVQLLKDSQRSKGKESFIIQRLIERLEFESARKLIELGRYEQAAQVIEKLSGIGLNPIRQGVLRLKLATEASKAGQIEFALQVSQRMKADAQYTAALRNIIIALAEQKNFDRALELAESLSPPDTQAYAIRPILYHLWKAGQTDRALQVANRLSEPDLVAGGLSTLATAAIELGQTGEAMALLNEAFHRLQEPSDPKILPLESWVSEEIALKWAKLGQYGQALKIVQQLRLSRTKDGLLHDIVLEMAQGQRYEQAIQVASTIKNSRIRTESLIGITAQLIQVREFDRALKLIDQFPDSLKFDSPERFTNVTRIVTGENLKSTLLSVTALTLIEQGQIERALQVSERIPDPFSRSLTIGMMAVSLYRSGQIEQADGLLVQSRQIARTAKPPANNNAKFPENFPCFP